MVEFKCLIHIGKYAFRNFIDVKIESTRKSITDKATIKLSNPGRKLDTAIATSDPVKIWMGYDDTMNLEFEGYVSEIKPNHPFEIMCEDETYLLKRETVNMSWKAVGLKTLIKYLVPDARLASEIPDVELKPYRIEYKNKLKALQDLKDDFGFDIYYRGKELFVGLAYTDLSVSEHVQYDFNRNIIPRKSELTYRNSNDVRIKVKAISVLSNGDKITEEYGEDNGEVHTRLFPNIKDKTALAKLAQEEHKKMAYNGYQGDFTTWLLPYVRHTQIADFTDKKFPERKGSNFIDAVITEVSKSGGARRKITPGRRIQL